VVIPRLGPDLYARRLFEERKSESCETTRTMPSMDKIDVVKLSVRGSLAGCVVINVIIVSRMMVNAAIQVRRYRKSYATVS
jgi:hypothetical protein